MKNSDRSFVAQPILVEFSFVNVESTTYLMSTSDSGLGGVKVPNRCDVTRSNMVLLFFLVEESDARRSVVKSSQMLVPTVIGVQNMSCCTCAGFFYFVIMTPSRHPSFRIRGGLGLGVWFASFTILPLQDWRWGSIIKKIYPSL